MDAAETFEFCLAEPAVCPVCCLEFTRPVTCAVCHRVYCADCLANVLQGSCVRCPNRSSYSQSTADDLQCQDNVTCKMCRWTGSVAMSRQHRCVDRRPGQTHQNLAIPEHLLHDMSRERSVPTVEPTRYMQVTECMNAVRVDPTSAAAWYHLAANMRHGEEASVCGTSITRIGCLCNALRLNPNDERAWALLGEALGVNAVCEVAGQRYSRRDCFIRTLGIEDFNSMAWTMLGSTIPQNEVLHLQYVGGKVVRAPVTAIECFRRALVQDNRNALAYVLLAERLPQEKYVPVNGANLTRLECCRIAIALDNSLGCAWRVLAETLEVGQAIMLQDGTSIDKPQAWHLAQLLQQREPIHLQRYR